MRFIGKDKEKALSPFSTILLVAFLSLVGLSALPYLQISYLPEDKGRNLVVSYSLEGASASFIETEVTSKIEGALNRVRACTGIESFSREGEGEVCLSFSDGRHLEAARLEVASAIRNIYPSLPSNLTYPQLTRHSGSRSRNQNVLIYTLKGNLPTMEIERYARTHLLPSLAALQEVNSVRLGGVTPWQWVITYDAAKAALAGITGADIIHAVQENRKDVLLGVTVAGDDCIHVRLVSGHGGQWGDIPIKRVGDKCYHLRDLATWKYEEKPASYYHRVNGLNTVTLSFGFVQGANLIRASKAVRDRMKEVGLTSPPEISMEVTYDASSYIKVELKKIIYRATFCLLLLLVFVYLVSRSWRYLCIISATIVSTILISLGLYALLGLQIHYYSLAGFSVSIGMLIDMAIVMADHFLRCHNRKILPALVMATLTTVGAMAVVFVLPASERVHLGDFIKAIVLTLAVSLLLAIFLIPAFFSIFPLKRDNPSSGGKRRQARARIIYARYIAWSLRHRWIFIPLTAITIACPCFFLYINLNQPTFNREPSRRQITIRASLQKGCTVAQLNEVIKKMENYLANLEGIEAFTTQVFSYDDAQIVVSFFPEWERGLFPQIVKQGIISQAKNYGGVDWFVSGLDRMVFDNTQSDASIGYLIHLEGYRYQELVRFAQTLSQYLHNYSHLVSDVRMLSAGSAPAPGIAYHWKTDASKVLAYGVDPLVPYYTLSSNMHNERIGLVSDDNGVSDLLVQSSLVHSHERWQVQNASLPADSLNLTLSSLGYWETRNGDPEIHRANQSYLLDVFFSYQGPGNVGRRLAQDAVDYMNQNILPLGYKAELVYGGLSETGKRHYFWLLAVAIAVIYFLLTISLDSMFLPLAILGLIPLSLSGLFLVFEWSGFLFDQGAYAAMIMLCGIVVNAGIYLLFSFRWHKGRNVLSSKKDLRSYLHCFSERVIPIMLTVLSTVLGLLPFLSDGPQEVFWFDFAAGTIGGMLFSLIGLVFLLPVYTLWRNNDSLN